MITPLLCVVIALVLQPYLQEDFQTAGPWWQTALVWTFFLGFHWTLSRQTHRLKQSWQPYSTGLLDFLALILYLLILPYGLALAEGSLQLASSIILGWAPMGEARPANPSFIWRWVALLPLLAALVINRTGGGRRDSRSSRSLPMILRFLALILLPYFTGSLLLEQAFWDLAALHLMGYLPDWEHLLIGLGLEWPLFCTVITGLLAILPILALSIIPTRPLPAGPLRESLVNQARDVGVSYGELRLWDAGPHTVNAAVMGTLPATRSLLITEGMIEAFSPQEIDLVFRHELGHITQRHLLIQYAFFITLPGLAILLRDTLGYPGGTVMEPLFIIAAWLIGFTWVSRTLERHADLYAMKSSAEPDQYPRMLLRLGLVTGVSPTFKSLTHGSLNGRVSFLESILENPRREILFQRRVCWIRRTLGVLLLAQFLWWILRFGLPLLNMSPLITH